MNKLFSEVWNVQPKHSRNLKRKIHTLHILLKKTHIIYILLKILHSIKITLKLSNILNPTLPSHPSILLSIMPVKHTSLLLPQN